MVSYIFVSFLRSSVEGLTFSIVAVSRETKELGVCVCTGSFPAVGSAVPHAKEGVAAIATQAVTNPSYGINGIRLLEEGHKPEEALGSMLNEDEESEFRQVTIINMEGRMAVHTGEKVQDVKGHILGRDFVVAGNILSNDKVLDAMARAYESSEGRNLAERLLASLEAGKVAGADTSRDGPSSALLVKRIPSYSLMRPHIDLRIDLDMDPVSKLRGLYSTYSRQMALIHRVHL
jgi:uncharacterized Ntn-hydrolase superfamily protein